MNRREFLKNMTLGAVGFAAGMPVISGEPKEEIVFAKRLPAWKGFNLLELFSGERPRPFRESDFEIMAQWGFNFVRIPMSYWNWSRPERWLEIDETIFQCVDEVMELGRQYGVHVCLNLHRIPGYCVNGNEREPQHLFDGPPEERCEALEAAQTHWRFIAQRYRDVPTQRLSFNLLNEPRDIPATDYAPVVTALVETIRAVNPERLIIADGLAWGTKPVPELAPLGIAQSTRGYEPMLISHYRASWINGSDTWPEPSWPVPVSMNQHLYGDNKPELKSPLVLRLENPQATQLSIRIGHVSGTAELLIGADGTTVLQKQFTPGPGEGDWKTSVPDQWGGYQADYGQLYTAAIPAGTREISVEVGKGDWLTFTEIR